MYQKEKTLEQAQISDQGFNRDWKKKDISNREYLTQNKNREIQWQGCWAPVCAVTPIPILKYACLVKDLAMLGRHYLFLDKAVVMLRVNRWQKRLKHVQWHSDQTPVEKLTMFHVASTKYQRILPQSALIWLLEHPFLRCSPLLTVFFTAFLVFPSKLCHRSILWTLLFKLSR